MGFFRHRKWEGPARLIPRQRVYSNAPILRGAEWWQLLLTSIRVATFTELKPRKVFAGDGDADLQVNTLPSLLHPSKHCPNSN